MGKYLDITRGARLTKAAQPSTLKTPKTGFEGFAGAPPAFVSTDTAPREDEKGLGHQPSKPSKPGDGASAVEASAEPSVGILNAGPAAKADNPAKTEDGSGDIQQPAPEQDPMIAAREVTCSEKAETPQIALISIHPPSDLPGQRRGGFVASLDGTIACGQCGAVGRVPHAGSLIFWQFWSRPVLAALVEQMKEGEHLMWIGHRLVRLQSADGSEHELREWDGKWCVESDDVGGPNKLPSPDAGQAARVDPQEPLEPDDKLTVSLSTPTGSHRLTASSMSTEAAKSPTNQLQASQTEVPPAGENPTKPDTSPPDQPSPNPLPPSPPPDVEALLSRFRWRCEVKWQLANREHRARLAMLITETDNAIDELLARSDFDSLRDYLVERRRQIDTIVREEH